jgi:sugar lactone lactonase YvrE
VDGNGRLIATEPEAGRIVRRDNTGAPDASWQLADSGSRPPKPIGVAVDVAGRIWVADGSGGQLLRLEQGP